MDGEYNVFEALGLGLDPPSRTEKEPGVAPLPSEDADLFAQLGVQVPEGQPQAPTVEARRVKRPATTRFQQEFEKKWEPEERRARWLEASKKNLLYDEPYPHDLTRGQSETRVCYCAVCGCRREFLDSDKDPYERDLHSTPHR